MKIRHLLIPLILAFGLGLTLALLWILGGRSTPAVAAPRAEPAQSLALSKAEGIAEGLIEAPSAPAAELHVCPSGCAYSSVQAAVDAANDGDVIKVAAGTYTDLSVRPRNDVTTTGVVTQVVYISKTVTIRGGYTTADWDTSNPEANPTTLDAQGQGRVLYITGDISPTIEGLRITGGDATGLGGGPRHPMWSAGGGVYVISATATFSGNQVFDNTVSESFHTYGGGLYLHASDATLIENTIMSNSSDMHGGGLFLWSSDATLNGNTVASNDAGNGGGLFLVSSDAMLISNIVTSNTVLHSGGGLFMAYSDGATLDGNTIASNTAGYFGGGLYVEDSTATFNGNIITSNAANYGGGLYLNNYSAVTLINNVIADNQASTAGSGLYIQGSSPRLLHTTIAHNTGGDGSGVYVTDHEWEPTYSTVVLTNTILMSHSVGISVTGGNTVTVNGVLWYNAPVTTSQSTTATVMVQNQHTGNPAFDTDGYHITPASAAIDAGVDAGVITDIDDDSRPIGRPDIGADEWGTRAFLPLVLRNR